MRSESKILQGTRHQANICEEDKEEDTDSFKYVIIKLLIKKVHFIPATTRYEGFTDPQSQTELVLLKLQCRLMRQTNPTGI